MNVNGGNTDRHSVLLRDRGVFYFIRKPSYSIMKKQFIPKSAETFSQLISSKKIIRKSRKDENHVSESIAQPQFCGEVKTDGKVLEG